MMKRRGSYRRGLLGLGHPKELAGIQGLLQHPLVADADWHHADIEHLPLEEGFHCDAEEA